MATRQSFQKYNRPKSELDNNYNFDYNRPNQNIDHYYNLENAPKEKTFICETCNASFFTHFMFKKHVNEHVQCPFPECKLTANMKVIDQHISHQHMMINFEALQIDDEAWIAQRKKQFPSVERAKLRMAEQLERNKRGERLGKDKRKFAKKNSNNESSSSDIHCRKRGNHNKGMNRNRDDFKKERTSRFKKEINGNEPEFTENINSMSSKIKNDDMKELNNISEFRNHDFNATAAKWNNDDQVQIPASAPIDSDSDDSDPENKFGIPAFTGTRALFENTGEISLFGVQTTSNAAEQETICDAEEQCSMDISDEEEWDDHSSSQVQEQKITFNNALGSLIGAYGSGSESDLDVNDKEKSACPFAETKPGSSLRTSNTDNRETHEVLQKSDTGADNSNCNSGNQYSNDKKHYGKRKRRHMPSGASKRYNRSKDCNKRIPKFNAANSHKRRHTLLEKLLKPDVVHERNVILQCIRYIVENNFFEPLPSSSAGTNITNDTVNEAVDKLTLLDHEDELPLTESADNLALIDPVHNLSLTEPTKKLESIDPEDQLALLESVDKFSLNDESVQNLPAT